MILHTTRAHEFRPRDVVVFRERPWAARVVVSVDRDTQALAFGPEVEINGQLLELGDGSGMLVKPRPEPEILALLRILTVLKEPA